MHEPSTTEYNQEDTNQIIKTFDLNDNLLWTSSGTINLNVGEGTPYGRGRSDFGEFTWSVDTEPEIDYSTGSIKIITRRTYSSGWYQDYEYNLPYPVNLVLGVNRFDAHVTSGGNNKPDVVPNNAQVQLVADEDLSDYFLSKWTDYLFPNTNINCTNTQV